MAALSVLAVTAGAMPSSSTSPPTYDKGGIHRTQAWASQPINTPAGGLAVVYYDLFYHRQLLIVPANLRILGQTQVEGVSQGPRSVRLYRRSDGAFIKAVVSLDDGSYLLPGLANAEYQVVAVDDAAGVVYNDVIAGRITPVP